MARPKGGRLFDEGSFQLGIRVDPATNEALGNIAEQRGISKSELARGVLEDFVAKLTKAERKVRR